MSESDLERPSNLSKAGNKAYDVIMAFLRQHDLTYAGGCKAFYTPEEWKSRGEQYGAKAELVVVHDGGDVAAVCNLDYENYGLHDALQEALTNAGLFLEGCTCWYSAVYSC